jgi:hypothetical protein
MVGIYVSQPSHYNGRNYSIIGSSSIFVGLMAFYGIMATKFIIAGESYIWLDQPGDIMNRAFLSMVLLTIIVTLAGAVTNSDCDVSACMKQIEWPAGGQGSNGTYGIYDQISTCVNITNNGFFSQEAWLVVRFTGPDGVVYRPKEDQYFTLPDVGTSRVDCSVWSALNVGPNGTGKAPDGWYNESVQLRLPSGDILDEENKTNVFQIKS